MKDTIHGYPVVARYSVPDEKNMNLVMVARKGDPMPFVVAFHRDGDEEWCTGHYCETFERANEVLQEKVARYVHRRHK